LEIGTGQGPVLYGWTTLRVWATRRQYLTVLILRGVFTTVTTPRTCLYRVAHRLYSTVSSIDRHSAGASGAARGPGPL